MNTHLIEQTIEHILDWEKGYVYHPSDEGGPTNFGITIPTLSTWLGRKATLEDIQELERPTAVAIYEKMFIMDTPYKDLVDPWTFKYVVDMGVMHKPKTVAKIVQKAARPLLKIDGLFGPQTLNMANELSLTEGTHSEWQAKLRFERVLHYGRRVRDVAGQQLFLVGWLKRAHAL